MSVLTTNKLYNWNETWTKKMQDVYDIDVLLFVQEEDYLIQLQLKQQLEQNLAVSYIPTESKETINTVKINKIVYAANIDRTINE